VRCPKCKAEVVAGGAPTAESAEAGAGGTLSQPTVAGASAAAIAADESIAGLSCPICLSTIQHGELAHRCVECDLVHHEECWIEIGGCGTFGCKQAPPIDKSESSAQAPLTAWGDTKDCPVCGERIKSIALKCRYCGSTFDTVDPLTVADLRTKAAERQKLGSVKQTVITLFAISLLGCAAPIIAVIAAIYVPAKRRELAKCGPLYKIMGWTSLVLSCFYSLLMVLFIAMGD
jgi:hypothetical protein